jgi:antitoxin HigA-1
MTPNAVPHPGKVLRDDYLKPYKISQSALARATGISAQRIGNIVKGRSSITLAVALKLAEELDTRATFWLRLQHDYDTAQAAPVAAADAPPQDGDRSQRAGDG